MEILYVSSHCSPRVFDWLFKTLTVKPQQQAQKFHSLIVRGLALQSDVRATALSRFPVSRTHTKRMLLRATNEVDGAVSYIHLPHLNIPLGATFGALCAFAVAASWCFKHRRTQQVIICDALNLAVSVAARLAGSFFRVKTVAIVTDLPDQMQQYVSSTRSYARMSRWYNTLSNPMLERYDSYIFLTKEMNAKVNHSGRPYMVMEGLVAIHEEPPPVDRNKLPTQRVVMYAGALYAKYGVKALLEAFSMLPNISAQLWICGAGDLEAEIREWARVDARVHYLGVIPNKEVVAMERQATLLVNPRPSSEEFTKYSFPSKNMEYMVSGTPVLTTKLPGMPEEYHKYVYLFDDESVEGMARTLESVLSLSAEELRAKGIEAREFVLREKNNLTQTKRIIEMIRATIK